MAPLEELTTFAAEAKDLAKFMKLLSSLPPDPQTKPNDSISPNQLRKRVDHFDLIIEQVRKASEKLNKAQDQLEEIEKTQHDLVSHPHNPWP